MKKAVLLILGVVFAATLVAQDLKVMTFNLRYEHEEDHVALNWSERKEGVVYCIEKELPDVIGTQEGLIAQIKYLDKELKGYARVGIAREDGKEQGEHSAIYYSKKRFKLISSENSWLSETPDKPSLGWDAACIRIATTAVLLDKETGKTIHFINTHFDHVGKEARRNSPKFILEKVAAAGDDAVVFTGDLNASYKSEPIQGLVGSGVLVDCYVNAETKEGVNYSFHGFREMKEGRGGIIDYIMVNKALTPIKTSVISYKHNDKFLSDHNPIVAILKYK